MRARRRRRQLWRADVAPTAAAAVSVDGADGGSCGGWENPKVVLTEAGAANVRRIGCG
eukprot:SAG11_NODE_2294_length_3556_cov_3.734741_1_plen_57_part_10